VRHALKWHHSHKNKVMKSLPQNADPSLEDAEALAKVLLPQSQAMEAQPVSMETERQTACDDAQTVENSELGCV
jgi:hypothetical protein